MDSNTPTEKLRAALLRGGATEEEARTLMEDYAHEVIKRKPRRLDPLSLAMEPPNPQIAIDRARGEGFAAGLAAGYRRR
jgi:hypothetical protein